jgi:hypothetical protein
VPRASTVAAVTAAPSSSTDSSRPSSPPGSASWYDVPPPSIPFLAAATVLPAGAVPSTSASRRDPTAGSSPSLVDTDDAEADDEEEDHEDADDVFLGPPCVGEVPLLPTVVVDATTDLAALAAQIRRCFVGDKVVLKENFSAGMEGVTFLKLDPGDRRGEKLARDLEAHRFIMQARANNNPIVSPAFIVQQYQPRFLTEAEVRSSTPAIYGSSVGEWRRDVAVEDRCVQLWWTSGWWSAWEGGKEGKGCGGMAWRRVDFGWSVGGGVFRWWEVGRWCGCGSLSCSCVVVLVEARRPSLLARMGACVGRVALLFVRSSCAGGHNHADPGLLRGGAFRVRGAARGLGWSGFLAAPTARRRYAGAATALGGVDHARRANAAPHVRVGVLVYVCLCVYLFGVRDVRMHSARHTIAARVALFVGIVSSGSPNCTSKSVPPTCVWQVPCAVRLWSRRSTK